MDRYFPQPPRAIAVLLAAFGWAAGAAAQLANPSGEQFFNEQVKPLLQASCLKCHGGADKVKGGLKLTRRDSLLQGGDTGPAISTGQPAKSLLLDAINYRGDLQMPPKEKLPPEQIAILTKWVESGAPWPAGVDLAPTNASAAAVRPGPPKPDAEARKFWSFQPVQHPAVPQVQRSEWVRNPIDAFVLAKLESRQLAPAPAADKVTLLRRAYYDLTGLPPTPAEVQAFVDDASPNAYERVIDRLLASPHYGEKWGRHWLDLVRFAETNSYERDGAKPNAWRFRDYVIRSFNADKPYDRFVREQLAGDEMPRGVDEYDPLIATGYYRLGIWDDEPADRLQQQFEVFDDIVSTTGEVFLGLTVGCARCHDHKIDPIPQKDYYKLLSFVRNITPYRNGGPTDEAPMFSRDGDKAAYERRARERDERLAQVGQLVKAMEKDFVQLISGEPELVDAAMRDVKKVIRSDGRRVLGPERYAQYTALRKEQDDLTKPDAGVDRALVVSETGPAAPETFVLVRGNAGVPGAKVEPGFLEIFNAPDPKIPAPAPGAKTTGRRTALANWITAADHPLTARVMANRVFQYHFGRGIVRSPNNFGFQGDKPTHPELLDWLAGELVAGGWRLKPLHRLIMTSNAYRMASIGDPGTAATARAADPQNDLLWRFDLRRLTAEEVRDSILDANGSLNLAMFGPSVFPKIPAEVLAGQSRPGQGWRTSTPEEACRRSVYVHVKRSLRVPIIESMDVAEADKSCPVRFVTVQPTQALGLVNSTFLNEEAAKFAARLRKEAGAETRPQVELALRLALCRAPGEREVARGIALVDALQLQDGNSREAAMKYFCLMVYNLNEFVYLD